MSTETETMIKILPSKKNHKPDCFTDRLDQIFSEKLIPTCFPHSSVGKESTCNAGDPGERNTQKEEGRENENKGQRRQRRKEEARGREGKREEVRRAGINIYFLQSVASLNRFYLQTLKNDSQICSQDISFQAFSESRRAKDYQR